MAEAPIDQEARKLSPEQDQKDLARSFRITKEVVGIAILIVAVLLIVMAAIALR